MLLSSLFTKENDKNNIFKEFFSGLKGYRKTRFYSVMIIMKRLIYIPLLICLNPVVTTFGMVFLMSICEIINFMLFLVTMPFESTKDNLIEGINLVCYAFYLNIQFFINESSDWTNGIKSIILSVFTCNSLIVLVILLFCLLKVRC